MKDGIQKYMLLIAAVFYTGLAVGQPCTITQMKTEYLVNPLGLDNPHPRLTWQMQDSRAGARQTSYQVWVGTDSLAVLNGDAKVWSTGKVKNGTTLLRYQGAPLKPYIRYFWKVVAGDLNGASVQSPVASFEMGHLGMMHWQGAWISDGADIDKRPAPYFRKTFQLGKNIRSARAYIAVGGLYELYVNGERIGDHQLDPLYTNYAKRNLYVTYDITSQLQQGKNVLGVLLGNGWYNHQALGVWNFERAPWRNRPAFCMDVRVTYTDGTTEVIPTDLSWKTSSGPLIYTNIYTGEHYDFRLEQKGWNTVNFDDSKWHGVGYRKAPSGNITAQQAVPIRNVEAIPAVSLKKFSDTNYVYDFGRNMAGVTRVVLKGKAGTKVKIIHGERLYPDGHVDQSNIDVYYTGDKEKEPFQTDILYLDGNEDEFMARFNYKGFHYVEVVSDQPLELNQGSITAYFMHSDVEKVGHINSASKLVNQLCFAADNSYLSNLMGYPTDCPQREKNGWTGDGHLAIETALYNFDGITVYEKWLADHRDEQQPNGVLPDIIPTGGWGYGTDNGLDWTSTIAIIPWNLYLFYGDLKPLADNYENIKSYVDYVERTSDGLISNWGRGDWVPVKTPSDKKLTNSCYFYKDACILRDAARLLDKLDDYAHYADLAERIRKAVNDKYLDREKGIYASGSQTELSVPLHWGLVPDEMVEKVAYNLNQKVVESNYHLDVGVLGSKALLNALCMNGYQETAYRVAVQDTYPSWGWWMVNGHTTLLENWDLEAARDISDNHMMFGEIGAYFYKGLGGIYPDPAKPGYRHIILKPYFVKEMGQFESRFRGPQGEIVSKWQFKGKKVTYTVTIPANSTATLTLPTNVQGEHQQELKAGTYVFTLKVK